MPTIAPIKDEDPASADTGAGGWLLYLILFLVLFALSALATVGWQNRAYISQLFYQSSLARHQVMTGEAGPATFYVFHSNYGALEQLARSRDDILGIETSEFSGVAAMAFTSLDVDGVELIRTHPDVVNMVQQNIPMLCH